MSLALLGAGPEAGGGAFDPLSLSPALWLDATDVVAGAEPADGAGVPSWQDKSGNGRTATSSGGNPAVYKTNILNGLPVVRFVTLTNLTSTAAWTALTQPNTIFLVASMSAASNYYFDGVASGNRHAFFDNGSNLHDQYAGSEITAAQSLPTSANCWTLVYNGASSSVRKNAAAFSSGNAGANTLTGLTIGNRFAGAAGTPLNGDIAEVLLYNAALSSTDRDKVEAYLKAKWGTP